MEQGQISDESLMERVVDGKRASLDILVRRHANPLLTFIVRMIGDSHRSEELFQEVFLTVWVKRRQYNRFYRFKPWLYQIALNKCRASFRRQPLPVRHPYEDEALAIASDCPPSEAALAVETQHLIAGAVATLPEKLRAVLVLRIWSKLPYSEISMILNRNENTVRSNMHHALDKLRAYLEPRMQ